MFGILSIVRGSGGAAHIFFLNSAAFLSGTSGVLSEGLGKIDNSLRRV